MRAGAHVATALAAAVIAAAVIAAGCSSDSATPARDARGAGDTAAAPAPAPDTSRAAAVTMSAPTTTLQVTPGTVAGGAQFVVRFSMRNDQPDSTRLTLSCNGAARFALRTADAPPDSEPLESTVCAEAITTHVVPPGAELVLQLPSVAQAGRPPRPLAPGLYVVTATPTLIEADGRPMTLRPISAELRVR